MKNKQFKEFGGYKSPKAQILGIEPESVLCSSGEMDEVTGNTGADWWVGDDAEW